jgi:hypothetical protein
MEGSQHRDGERLSKSPGAANQLNSRSVFKLSDIFRLVEICHSRLANSTEVRYAQGKPFQLAGYHEIRARWHGGACAVSHERNPFRASVAGTGEGKRKEA